MAKQETLTLFPELEQTTRKLTDEQFGILMRAVCAYRFRGEAYSGDDIAIDIAFQFVASQVDRSEETKTSRSRSAAARWEKADTNESKPMQTDANVCKPMQTDASGMQTDAPILSIPIHSNPFQSLEEREEAPPPPPAPPKPARKAYGQFGWVKLSDEEYHRLSNDLGEAEVKRCIAYVDESAQSTGNKNRWRDWNLVVRKCHREGWGANRAYQKPTQNYTHGADRLSMMLNRGDFDD